MNIQAELDRLREENARLKYLLKSHGIAWEEASAPCKAAAEDAASQGKKSSCPSQFSTSQKIAMFRRLFSGREDVYPKRWESRTKGTSGYVPACGNEWKKGICLKPKVKCADCPARRLMPVTDQVVYDHLSGRHTIGVYPLLQHDTCRFLAADFDEEDWKNDAGAYLKSCREAGIAAYAEISRSGKGAHVWIFFSEPVPAREARKLGSALLSLTCQNTRQLSLASYDRLFPNQDTMPKGGFGNLIALPLQKEPRRLGRSVFVNEDFQPCPDQWACLASVRTMAKKEVEDAVVRLCGKCHPLDVAFAEEDSGEASTGGASDGAEADSSNAPWKRPAPPSAKLPGTMPHSLPLILASQIFIPKDSLVQALGNRLIRMASFQNPEFYRAQAMRLPVWNKPRIITCAENHPKHIAIPRGLLDDVQALLSANGIRPEIQDERLPGQEVSVQLAGTLRKDQKAAADAMLSHDTGVLCAPTAFGKTVTAAAIIAQRKVSTLVLVHRTALMQQWEERLQAFLDIEDGTLGCMGGGKNRLSGKIDIAVIQSLVRNQDLHGILDQYGQIVVDECHHVSAFSFETLLKTARARFVLGLTATPVRRDGHHPVILMQCGPVRHKAGSTEGALSQMEVRPRVLPAPELARDSPIQEVFRSLATNDARNEVIISDVLAAYQEGRKVLVLTERTDHLMLLHDMLAGQPDCKTGHCFVLHGRLSKKQRQAVLEKLNSLDESAPRIILATGRLIGEGFDHPPLDTLVLAMPVSWKGTLQQYAGRLHRYLAGKDSIRLYDYAEEDQPQLARMWQKRLKGYKSMGYEVKPAEKREPA